jgi:hypothetical protein
MAARRPGAGRGVAERVADRGEDGGGVVPVDEQRAHADPDTPVGQRGGRGLLGQRHADRVAVVLHQENHGCLPYPGEVQRLVHITLAGRTVTGQHQRRLVGALELGGPGEADGVQGAGGQRRALRGDPVLVRVIAAVPLAAQQRQRLGGRDAPGQHGHRVAVGREQPVLLTKREDGPHLAGFLAARGRVHRQAPLPGQRSGLGVQPAADHHLAVQFAQDLVRGQLQERGLARTAELVDQAERVPAGR